MSTEVNIPLLRKAVEWVEEQDRLPVTERAWVQEEVILPEAARVTSFGHQPGCGSAYCVAGYVATLVNPQVTYLNAIPLAEEALGLRDLGYQHRLFRGYNSAADIRRIAEEIAGEKL